MQVTESQAPKSPPTLSLQRPPWPGHPRPTHPAHMTFPQISSRCLKLPALLYWLTVCLPREAVPEGRSCSPLSTLGTGGHANIG